MTIDIAKFLQLLNIDTFDSSTTVHVCPLCGNKTLRIFPILNNVLLKCNNCNYSYTPIELISAKSNISIDESSKLFLPDQAFNCCLKDNENVAGLLLKEKTFIEQQQALHKFSINCNNYLFNANHSAHVRELLQKSYGIVDNKEYIPKTLGLLDIDNIPIELSSLKDKKYRLHPFIVFTYTLHSIITKFVLFNVITEEYITIDITPEYKGYFLAENIPEGAASLTITTSELVAAAVYSKAAIQNIQTNNIIVTSGSVHYCALKQIYLYINNECCPTLYELIKLYAELIRIDISIFIRKSNRILTNITSEEAQEITGNSILLEKYLADELTSLYYSPVNTSYNISSIFTGINLSAYRKQQLLKYIKDEVVNNYVIKALNNNMIFNIGNIAVTANNEGMVLIDRTANTNISNVKIDVSEILLNDTDILFNATATLPTGEHITTLIPTDALGNNTKLSDKLHLEFLKSGFNKSIYVANLAGNMWRFIFNKLAENKPIKTIVNRLGVINNSVIFPKLNYDLTKNKNTTNYSVAVNDVVFDTYGAVEEHILDGLTAHSELFKATDVKSTILALVLSHIYSQIHIAANTAVETFKPFIPTHLLLSGRNVDDTLTDVLKYIKLIFAANTNIAVELPYSTIDKKYFQRIYNCIGTLPLLAKTNVVNKITEQVFKESLFPIITTIPEIYASEFNNSQNINFISYPESSIYSITEAPVSNELLLSLNKEIYKVLQVVFSNKSKITSATPATEILHRLCVYLNIKKDIPETLLTNKYIPSTYSRPLEFFNELHILINSSFKQEFIVASSRKCKREKAKIYIGWWERNHVILDRVRVFKELRKKYGIVIFNEARLEANLRKYNLITNESGYEHWYITAENWLKCIAGDFSDMEYYDEEKSADIQQVMTLAL